MKIIIDNNVLFSLMKPNSVNSRMFSILNFEYFAPSFILSEFKKYEKLALNKSGLTKDNFLLRKKDVFDKIKLLDFKDYKRFLREAIKFSPDKDDSLYFALALKLNCPIWSNDKLLKNQNKVEILSTEDIVNILF